MMRIAMLSVGLTLTVPLLLEAQEVSYAKQVVPFFNTYCIRCHTNAKPRGDVSLETHADVLKADILRPGKAVDSILWQTMVGKGSKMPPKSAAQPTAQEVSMIKTWIEQGAKDDSGGKAIAKAGPGKNGPIPGKNGPGNFNRRGDDDERRGRMRRGEDRDRREEGDRKEGQKRERKDD